MNELISNQAVTDIVKGMDVVERQVFDILRKYLTRFDLQNGDFVATGSTAQIINEMNREIALALSSSSLDGNIDKFLVNFDEIGENVRRIHADVNDVNVPKALVNRQKQFAIDNTIYSLKEAQVSTHFTQPIRQLLFRRVTTGASLLDTERELRILMLGDKERLGAFRSWVGQIARDSINQYEGSIHQAVKNEFGFQRVRYIGGLVTDSREQCKRWEGIGTIDAVDLPAEINWAKNEGSGMILTTDVDNFLINRGGYNCRHRAIPVR